jgi:hypothetical protein
MSDNLGTGFLKFLSKALALIYHIILLIIYVIGTWVLDKILKVLNPNNHTFSTWLETYEQPVILLTLGSILVITMFGEYIPRKKVDRFEWVVNNEDIKATNQAKEATNQDKKINNSPNAVNKENDEIYQ